ncbi:MAG: T9SS type A sorting domain-containing protein, partial [Bacteroidetes bacterium]|nr:T9SS type A sorting domain-containing protein [Bacteroidota bacterium]
KVNVNPTPLPTITGTNSICLGAVNIAYTTQAGMTGYNWTVSAGGTITAGAGTNTITLTWNTLGSQTVGVNYTSILGCTAATPSIMNVTVNPMPAPVITGNGSMCVSSGYYDYATQTGMTNYTWSISPGGTILFGTGTNLVTVTWDVPGPQWLKVNYTNSSGCTATAPTQLNIMVNPLPGAAGTVLGSVSVCAGAAGVNYSTTLIPDAVTYVWSLPMGASIASGSGTNSILVDFGPNAQPGDVTVYGNNLCGNGTLSASLQVAVSALPGNAGTPTGEEEVCQGDTGVIYYVSPIANAVYYIWEITGGGVITTGNGTNSIRAKFPVGPATCGITVYASNACGAGLISGLRSVLVNALPPVPVVTQNGNQLVSSAPFGNQWYFNGILIAGADQATLTPDKSGAYSVIVTLSGCSSEASDGFFYVMTGTASPEPFSVKVYPVPNDGLFRVDLNGGKPELVRLSVLNGLGQKIYEHQGIELSGERQHKVDLRPVPPGVYTLILESGTYRVIRKIVVDGN